MRIVKSAVKQLRWERGWTQTKLAALTGLTRQAINEIETGRSPGSPGSAKALADAFGVAVADIVADNDPQEAVS